MDIKIWPESQFVVVSGRTHVSKDGEYFFDEDIVYSIKDSYEKKLKTQLKSETDPLKISQLRYLILTLRIERAVRH